MIFDKETTLKDFSDYIKKNYNIFISIKGNNNKNFYNVKFNQELNLGNDTTVGELCDFFYQIYRISLIFYATETAMLPKQHRLGDTENFVEKVKFNKTVSGKIARIKKISLNQSSYSDIDQYQRFFEKILFEINEEKHILEIKDLLDSLKINNDKLYRISYRLIESISENNASLKNLL